MDFTPDGVHATDVTLLWALHEAYGISDDELWSGGPAWINQKRFDIEAKFDVSQFPKPTLQDRQAMLQQLLADRFKLAVHHATKQFPVYALVVAKGGPKFQGTKPEDLRQSPTYGVMCNYKRAGKGAMELSGCTLSQFASGLGEFAHSDLGRRVVDQTGLSGHYTIALHWAPLSTAIPVEQGPNPQDPAGPSLFTEVKEQLGLELKPANGSIDTMVIDHAELPTEN